MMLTLNEARKIVEKNLPGANILSGIDFEDKYLFIAQRDDPLEGDLDPFFSVEKENGSFIDFSPQDYPDPLVVITRLQQATD